MVSAAFQTGIITENLIKDHLYALVPLAAFNNAIAHPVSFITLSPKTGLDMLGLTLTEFSIVVFYNEIQF